MPEENVSTKKKKKKIYHQIKVKDFEFKFFGHQTLIDVLV